MDVTHLELAVACGLLVGGIMLIICSIIVYIFGAN